MMDIIAWLQMHVLQEDYYQFYVGIVFLIAYFEIRFGQMRKVIQAWSARSADTEPKQ